MPRKTNFTVASNDKGKKYEYFRTSATIGKNPDGSPIRKTFYGASKKEAESKRDEHLEGLRQGLKTDFKNMYVRDLMKIWLFSVMKQNSSHNTFERYEGVFRNYVLNNSIAGLRVYEVKRLTLQTHYNQMKESGFSDSQIFHLNKLLKTFFNYAVQEDYILKNPCIGIKVSRKPKNSEDGETEVDPFTDDEIRDIICASTDTMHVLFQLCLGTGLRRSELLGLRVKDLDLDAKELKVNVMLKRIKVFKTETEFEYVNCLDNLTKTPGSVRTIPIPSGLIPMLSVHLQSEIEKHRKLGLHHGNDSLFFTSEACSALWGKNVLTSFKRLLKRANVRYRCFHNIRHTYATKLFEKRVPLITISRLLGHSSTNITADVYIGVMPKEKINAAEELNYLFG